MPKLGSEETTFEKIGELPHHEIENVAGGLTKKLNTKIHEILDKIQKISFFLLVAALIGFLGGAYASYRFFNMKMNESVLVGGIVYKGDVYNMSKRDVIVQKVEQKVDVKNTK